MKKVLFVLSLTFLFTINIQAQEQVNFKLRNETMRSIPLKIPGVMNPNLSPRSNSGVMLAIGQKIFYTDRGKKLLLLEVNKEYEGKIIKVGKLIKAKSKTAAKN